MIISLNTRFDEVITRSEMSPVVEVGDRDMTVIELKPMIYGERFVERHLGTWQFPTSRSKTAKHKEYLGV